MWEKNRITDAWYLVFWGTLLNEKFVLLSAVLLFRVFVFLSSGGHVEFYLVIKWATPQIWHRSEHKQDIWVFVLYPDCLLLLLSLHVNVCYNTWCTVLSAVICWSLWHWWFIWDLRWNIFLVRLLFQTHWQCYGRWIKMLFERTCCNWKEPKTEKVCLVGDSMQFWV